MPLWARLTVALAVARVVAALAVYAAGASEAAARPVPLWVHAALAATFSVIALGLVLGHQNDRRASWLGGLLALVGCPLAVPLLSNDALLGWLVRVRPDAFLGAFAWEFVACFPNDLKDTRARMVKGAAAAGVLVGIFLGGAHLAAIWPGVSAVLPRSILAVSRNPVVFYWPVLLAVAVPAFFALLWRARVAEGAARRRVQVFVAGLLAGVGPFAIGVFVEGIWDAYANFVHAPGIEPWVGAVMFAALASLPLTTAYSVLFDRVVSVRIVLHKALQHALARYTILALTLIPFGGLVVYVTGHRDEPLSSLLAPGQRPLILGGLALLGVLALRVRPGLLAALDRRYFREPFDAGRILERLMARPPHSTGELGSRLSEEIGAAFHATVYVLLPDETRGVLRDAEERLQPLSAMTPLLTLADPILDVAASRQRAASEVLPEHERRWLASSGVSLIAAVRTQELGPVGLIALTPKLSELPYTEVDRRFLATVASAAALAVERFSRRRDPSARSEPAARECERCFTIYASAARQCVCGGTLVEAAVPHVLRGVFRLEQRIASGSLGVVYRAVDLGLGRNVAIKTLADVAHERMPELVREARAMARVSHANLAVVHGVETWRGGGFLVQEYLENGTLARRLFSSRLAVHEAIDLGLTLGDLLVHLHRYELIHCDIKPSNIGYTADHVVKLFDFGLARRVEASSDRTARGPRGLVGTPSYMSPEAIRGELPSPAVDLWALSVVLYEAIAGRRPFDGPTTSDVLAAILRGAPTPLSELVPGIPPGLSGFFETALCRDRAARPRSAEEFVRALADVRRMLDASTVPGHASRVAEGAEVKI